MKLPTEMEKMQPWFRVMAGGAVVGVGAVGIAQGIDLGTSDNLRVGGVDLRAGAESCADVRVNIEGSELSMPVKQMLLDQLDNSDDCDDLWLSDDANGSGESGPATEFSPSVVQPVDNSANSPSNGGSTSASFDNSFDSPNVAPTAIAQSPAPVSPTAQPSFDSPDSFDSPVDNSVASFDGPDSVDSPDDSAPAQTQPSAPAQDLFDSPDSFDSPDDVAPTQSQPAPAPVAPAESFDSPDSPDGPDSFDSPDDSD